MHTHQGPTQSGVTNTAYAATDNVIEFNYAERKGVGKGLNGTSICPAASFIIGDKRNILRHNIADDGGVGPQTPMAPSAFAVE